MQYLKSYNISGEFTIWGFFHLSVHQLMTYWVCKLMSPILSFCHLLRGSRGSSFFDKAIDLFWLRWYRESKVSKVGLLSVWFIPATTARVGGIARQEYRRGLCGSCTRCDTGGKGPTISPRVFPERHSCNITGRKTYVPRFNVKRAYCWL